MADVLSEQGRADRLIAVLILLVLAAALAWAQQPVNLTQVSGTAPVAEICGDQAKITYANINLTAGTGNTELVALSGQQIIYVCSYFLQVGGADGTQFITGTGAACATDEADIQTFKFTADGDGAVENGGGAVIFKTAAGAALCLERTSSVAAVGRIGYVRQNAPA